MAQVRTFELDAGAWQGYSRSWDDILNEIHPPQVRLIFTSTTSVTEAPPQVYSRILKHYRISSMLFARVCRELNGFCGCEDTFGEGYSLEGHNIFFRFLIKQTHASLRPKTTFTQHTPDGPTVHGRHTIPHGWEWYEMGFFVRWLATKSVTAMYLDIPDKLRNAIESAVSLETNSIDYSNPYEIPLLTADEIIKLYDESVWSLRNHIAQQEATRAPEPDLLLLHEIARHVIHSSETLTVSVETMKSMLQQHEEFFRENVPENIKMPSRARKKMQFQTRMLQGLLKRSEANGYRLQNELGLSFNLVAQRDSQVQVQIGRATKRDSTAMKTIAIMTMLFLPGTFVSAIFGMNFFDFSPRSDTESETFSVSRSIWVYWAFAAPLTLATLASWFVWERRMGRGRLE